MAKPDFYGPRLKIERAEHHIDKLELIFRTYIRSNRDRMWRKANRHKRKMAVSDNFGIPLPRHTPTTLGDAIHNLKAALDHAYCLLVEANGGAIGKFTLFPFGEKRSDLRASMKGHVDFTKFSDAIIDGILDGVEPYGGGKLRLYALHQLDITDKHRVILPVRRQINIESLGFTDAAGKPVGSPLTGFSIIMADGQNAGDAIGTGTSGLKVEDNPKISFDILFGKGPMENESVCDTLRVLVGSVKSSLTVLESLFP